MEKKLFTVQDHLKAYEPKKLSKPIHFILWLLKILFFVLVFYQISGSIFRRFVALFTHGSDEFVINLGYLFFLLSFCIFSFFKLRFSLEKEKIRKNIMAPKVRELVEQMKDSPYQDVENAVLNFAKWAHLEITQREKRLDKIFGKVLSLGILTLFILLFLNYILILK